MKTLIPENILKNSLSKPIFNLYPVDEVITIYVREDGDDLNDGLTDSSTGALRNLPTVIKKIASSNTPNCQYKIQLGSGSWNVNDVDLISIRNYQFTLTGVGENSVLVVSDLWNMHEIATFSMSNLRCVFSGNGCIRFAGGYVNINNIIFDGSSTTFFLIFAETATSNIVNCSFNINAEGCIHVNHKSVVWLDGNIAINGNCNVVMSCFDGAISRASNLTFGGTVSGRRYHVSGNGVINTSQAGPYYIPGTIDGSADNGGIYV